jgi:hypothetical protein
VRRQGAAVVLAWVLPLAAAAQAPPTNPPASTSGPTQGGPSEPAPGGSTVPRPGTLHRFWLHEGDRLRLWEPARGLVASTATLVGSDVRGFTVVRQGSAEAIAFTALERLEVRRGPRHPWVGAWIGAVAGMALYASSGWDLFNDDVRWEKRTRHALLLTGSGAAAGGLFAGLYWHPRWVPVDLSDVHDIPPRTDLQSRLAPAGGPSVHVTLRF